MNQYQTANQIAGDLRKDPRTVAIELHRAGIKPDAELVSETGKRKTQPIYDREKIKKALAADLLKAAQRNAQDNFEAQWAERRKRFEETRAELENKYGKLPNS
jgi:hypothetical protein